MFLSRSLRRKLVATTIAVVAIMLVYDATVVDSHKNADLSVAGPENTPPTAGARLRFVTTAYCQGQKTASGVGVTTGIVAADPKLLPVGSVVELDTLPGRGGDNLPDKYRGIYTVMDTGPMITGKHVDVYLWNCNEALSFGKREAVVTVLRLGWHPKNSRLE
jgi:3D (Asp-Asp-Asp) domain-containing protein